MIFLSDNSVVSLVGVILSRVVVIRFVAIGIGFHGVVVLGASLFQSAIGQISAPNLV